MFFSSQARTSMIPEDTSLAGKTVLVTGANVGLGFATARQILLLRPATLIVTARSRAKCEDTVRRLSADPQIAKLDPAPNIYFAELALESFESVRAFVVHLSSLTDHLDVVVQNAGMNGSDWAVSKDEHEMILQVNYLSAAYLLVALLPLLRKTHALTGAPAHYTWVSSIAQNWSSFSKVPFDSLGERGVLGHFDDRKKFAWSYRYQDSKALASWFVAELASHVDSQEVLVNSVCPGVVRGTDLDRTQWWPVVIISSLIKRFFGHDVAEGARRYIHASLVVGPESHGKFLSGYSEKPIVTLRTTEKTRAARTKAYDETIAEIRKVDPSAVEGL